MAPVVVFELNEVPWKVLDWWTARHPESALAELVATSAAFTSVTPDEGHLSPWVTWPTVHRGVPNTVHGIGHFGQDLTHADAVAPPWWTTLKDAGRRTGVFGLLHTGELPADVEDHAFYVPDTFAPTVATHPDSLEPFQAFNLAMARASARNVSTAIDTAAARRFLTTAVPLGLRAGTAARLGRQLVEERRRPTARVRRRSFQSVLAFDLFARQLGRTQPHVAGFFTNHVASAMHRYWAATFPEDYPRDEFGFDVDWVRTWRHELDDAMGHADRMVARLLAHGRWTGSTLVVLSSMGQAAAQGTPVGRQLYLRDVQRFAAAAGLADADWERRPAMDPQVSLRVTPASVHGFVAWLRSLTVGDAAVEFDVDDDGFVSVTFGQADDAIGTVAVAGVEVAPAEVGLEIIEIEDEVASTGYHIPEGILLVHRPHSGPGRSSVRAEIRTTSVAPFLHRLHGLDPAPHHVEDGEALLEAASA